MAPSHRQWTSCSSVHISASDPCRDVTDTGLQVPGRLELRRVGKNKRNKPEAVRSDFQNKAQDGNYKHPPLVLICYMMVMQYLDRIKKN